MKKLLFPLCLLPSLAFGQWYAAGSAGYLLRDKNTDHLNVSVTIGREIAGITFLEYCQQISLSVQTGAPQMFQVRTGIIYDWGELTFKPFVGTSLTSAPENEDRKAALGFTAGLTVLQSFPGKDFQVKYEAGISNNLVFTPSVGFQFNL